MVNVFLLMSHLVPLFKNIFKLLQNNDNQALRSLTRLSIHEDHSLLQDFPSYSLCKRAKINGDFPDY